MVAPIPSSLRTRAVSMPRWWTAGAWLRDVNPMTEAFDPELIFIAHEMASPKARSRMLATFAREEIAIAKSANEAAIGRTTPEPRITVDCRRDARSDR